MSAILPPSQRLWWKQPIAGQEWAWIGIAFVWAMIMFIMMTIMAVMMFMMSMFMMSMMVVMMLVFHVDQRIIVFFIATAAVCTHRFNI